MAFTPKTVLECIHWEYAKLIADAKSGGRPGIARHPRAGSSYWAVVNRTFTRLKSGELKPSSLLRENKLLMNDGRACTYCGSPGPLHWEHVIPLSRGGPDTIDNLVYSCAGCNLQKGKRNPIEWYADRGLDEVHVPRLVMGKLLKLVLEEHRLRGTLVESEFPPGERLTALGVSTVFETLPAVPAR